MQPACYFCEKDTCTENTGTRARRSNQEQQVPDLRPSKIDQVAVEVPAFGNQVQDEARYPKGILRGRKQGKGKEKKENLANKSWD